MDTEKIKQMGRDYFTANPNEACRPLSDEAFKTAFNQGGGGSMELARAWRAGWKEARYAASKEGRAIELLGRLYNTPFEENPIWEEVSAFLQEIGWKPNA